MANTNVLSPKILRRVKSEENQAASCKRQAAG